MNDIQSEITADATTNKVPVLQNQSQKLTYALHITQYHS